MKLRPGLFANCADQIVWRRFYTSFYCFPPRAHSLRFHWILEKRNQSENAKCIRCTWTATGKASDFFVSQISHSPFISPSFPWLSTRVRCNFSRLISIDGNLLVCCFFFLTMCRLIANGSRLPQNRSISPSLAASRRRQNIPKSGMNKSDRDVHCHRLRTESVKKGQK